jgi:hypothetical protein
MGKSIACCKDRITASSSNSNANDHESLDVDQEQAPENLFQWQLKFNTIINS